MINFLNRYNIGKKKLIGIGIFVILFLIALPLTLIQVQKQQEIRQRAEGLNNVYLELKPSREGKNAIDTQFAQTLYLQNPLNKDISGVDISLTYNNDSLYVIDFISENNLSYIVKDANIPGEVHLVGINSRQIHIIDSSIPLGAFIFKAKKEGNGTIDFSKVTITATNETQPIQPTYNKAGVYETTSKTDSTIVLSGDINKDKTIDEDDLKAFIDHYDEKEDKFDINGDKIVDGVDYNILLRLSITNGAYNPATIAFIDFIQGALAAELPSFLPNVGSLKEIPAITTSDLVIWKKTIGILGSTAAPALDLLGNFNLVHSLIKAARIKDLTEQITIYELVEYHAEQGKTIDEILEPYKDKAEIYDGRSLISTKGRKYLDNKYDSLLNAYREKCREVKKLKKEGKKPNAEDEGACLFPALAEADISELKANEARLIKQMGSPILNALAKYDIAVRSGENGFDEGLEVYYYLAKRFDEKTEYGSAVEIYDGIATNSPNSEIGRLSKERIRQLHSVGHQAKRVFFHIGASLVDPTIIIPINMCGPGSVGCKLVGKTLLKPAIVTKNVAKHGAEKVVQLLVTDYGIRKEAAEAVIEVSSKLVRDEAGNINFGKIVTVQKTIPEDAVSIIPEILENTTKRNQDNIQREVQSIARIKGTDSYRNQFLSDLRKKGGHTIKAAHDILRDRGLKYVDHYAKIGFLSTSSAKTFRQTIGRLIEDLVEEVGRNADGYIDTLKLMKIDELTHKTVAAVSNLEHVASSQRFSDHSYRHLHEDLSKALNAIEAHQRNTGSSPFTRRDKIYLSFISFLHDIGYTDADIVQRPLNFFETKKHPQRAFEFVRSELQKDLKEVLGEKSARIIKETLESDIEEVVGAEGAVTIMHAVREHGNKSFTYSSKNLNANKRVAAVFVLADDLAVDKVPDFARYPEIAKIITDMFIASKKDEKIINEIDIYINKLKQFRDTKDSNGDLATRIYEELMEMDHGNTVLGNFRKGYRERMISALEKYRSSIPDIRFRQYKQAIETTTESEFPFTITPAIIEKTSFSLVNLPNGKIGAHVVMEISESLYRRLAEVAGESEAKGQVTKILEDLVARSSDEPVEKKTVKELSEKIFQNRGGKLGSDNDIVIKFVQKQREANVLRDMLK